MKWSDVTPGSIVYAINRPEVNQHIPPFQCLIISKTFVGFKDSKIEFYLLEFGSNKIQQLVLSDINIDGHFNVLF